MKAAGRIAQALALALTLSGLAAAPVTRAAETLPLTSMATPTSTPTATPDPTYWIYLPRTER